MSSAMKIISINRHRMTTDGKGVTTLVIAHHCPLRCAYCINDYSFKADTPSKRYSPEELLGELMCDNLYFLATGGGVTFGGGEPLLYVDFIEKFRQICPKEWKVRIETSLNVPKENAIKAASCADQLIVDIKDMNPDIYAGYTGRDNAQVKENLAAVKDIIGAENVKIRIPLIKDFNTPEDRENSKTELEKMGYNTFDFFEYKIKN